MSGLFSETMTYPQARTVFFQAVKGKSQEEIEQIAKEYRAIVPIITEREMKEHDGWMTSDTLE